jgi:hypothetical protein
MFELADKATRDLDPCRQFAGRQLASPPQVLNAFSQVHQGTPTKLHGDFRTIKNN